MSYLSFDKTILLRSVRVRDPIGNTVGLKKKKKAKGPLVSSGGPSH